MWYLNAHETDTIIPNKRGLGRKACGVGMGVAPCVSDVICEVSA
jgi:hypothetical protein